MKIVTVLGARPQFIKAAVLSRALGDLPEVQQILVHTGQHYDTAMSERFFRELDLPDPDYNLGIACGTHGAQTGRMLEAVERVLAEHRPDCVLVYGDTNSTLAGALAASKLHIPVAHVEAGLRSFSRLQPEEINRVLTDHLSWLLFAPTVQGVENLRREGIVNNVHLCGDVMYDAALFYAARAAQHSRILERLGLSCRGYILATIHRPENTDHVARLRTAVTALEEVSRDYPVVLPLHPRTRLAMQRQGLLESASHRLQLTEPVGYFDMMTLEQHARLIATDSGGVQKEAFFHRVPCVTLRETTEWTELVEIGWNRLAPPTSATEVAAILRSALTSTPRAPRDVYGGGVAGQKIAHILAQQHFLTPELRV